MGRVILEAGRTARRLLGQARGAALESPVTIIFIYTLGHQSCLCPPGLVPKLSAVISSFLTLDSIWHEYFISLTRFNLSSHHLGMQELVPRCCSSLVSLPKDLETFTSVIAKEKHCFVLFFCLLTQHYITTLNTLPQYFQPPNV